MRGCRRLASSTTIARIAFAAMLFREAGLKDKPLQFGGVCLFMEHYLFCVRGLRSRVRIDSRDWRSQLLLLFRMGERLARHHRFALAGVVEEDRFDNGSLLQIGRVQPVVSVHV